MLLMVIAVIRASLGLARNGSEPTSNAIAMRIELRHWRRASMFSLPLSVYFTKKGDRNEFGLVDRTTFPPLLGSRKKSSSMLRRFVSLPFGRDLRIESPQEV